MPNDGPSVEVAGRGGYRVYLADSATGVGLSGSSPGQIFESHPYLHIAAGLATTTVKNAPGVLKRIVINIKGVTNTLTVYDSLTGSGTVIGILDTTVDRDRTYDCTFATGLTVVSAGGTGADLTVVFD